MSNTDIIRLFFHAWEANRPESRHAASPPERGKRSAPTNSAASEWARSLGTSSYLHGGDLTGLGNLNQSETFRRNVGEPRVVICDKHLLNS